MCCMHLNRRQFLGVSTGALAGAALFGPMAGLVSAAPAWADDYWDPARPYQRWTRPTRVQPVLMYRTPQRREQTSWKSWGGVQTHEAANEEANRIAGELADLAKRADFPLEILPVIKVTSEEETAKAQNVDAEVTVLYPATGSGNMLRGCVRPNRTIVFVRHRSGPSYYWYEALSTRYLKPNTLEEDPENRPLSVDDVVVDEPEEL
ncbi:MAG: sugar isomerase, partial [Candidatus Hydrogenedentes bacterium]|nr:sugar isomerase [Candidatus Hydrogenedentota bacterium]